MPNWDVYIWGWVGDPDPTSLLSLFTTDQIEAGVNDCFYSNARYDELFPAAAGDRRRTQREAATSTEMQQLFYDDACYHVLYYDSELHAMRTDKFTGWTNQPPESGTPLFGFGYSGLHGAPGRDRRADAGPDGGDGRPAPTARRRPPPAPTAVHRRAPAATRPRCSSALVAVIAAIGGGFSCMRRRGGGGRRRSDGLPAARRNRGGPRRPRSTPDPGPDA